MRAAVAAAKISYIAKVGTTSGASLSRFQVSFRQQVDRLVDPVGQQQFVGACSQVSCYDSLDRFAFRITCRFFETDTPQALQNPRRAAHRIFVEVEAQPGAASEWWGGRWAGCARPRVG